MRIKKMNANEYDTLKEMVFKYGPEVVMGVVLDSIGIILQTTAYKKKWNSIYKVIRKSINKIVKYEI